MTCGRIWRGLLLSHALLLCLLDEGDDVKGPNQSTRLDRPAIASAFIPYGPRDWLIEYWDCAKRSRCVSCGMKGQQRGVQKVNMRNQSTFIDNITTLHNVLGNNIIHDSSSKPIPYL